MPNMNQTQMVQEMFDFFAVPGQEDNNESMLAASEFFKMVKLLKIYPVSPTT